MQVAQSVRAQQAGQPDIEAMHANAAGLMGQMAAAIAVLDMASGGGSFDQSGQVKITADHVLVSGSQFSTFFFGRESLLQSTCLLFHSSRLKIR